jgi:hypothetical protein
MQENKNPPVCVRSVKGRIVTRFGYPSILIGAKRDPSAPEGFTWSDDIVEIPSREYAEHRRAYDTAFAAGDLERVDDALERAKDAPTPAKETSAKEVSGDNEDAKDAPTPAKENESLEPLEKGIAQ